APALVTSAARLLAARKPPGAADALLDFVPAVTDENAREEVFAAIAAVTVRHGRPEEVLTRGLSDEAAPRRCCRRALSAGGPEEPSRRPAAAGGCRPAGAAARQPGPCRGGGEGSGSCADPSLRDAAARPAVASRGCPLSPGGGEGPRRGPRGGRRDAPRLPYCLAGLVAPARQGRPSRPPPPPS